ncbi:hypothetical protein Y1Q_0009248 [Alligator mississippiensis]|uniref:Uncharacterized protein n=1 Tax=Alligator mississippiensis TaxID=8496 RepID=A0A151M2X1_ALLMI|nr:hypothetical protein Y1Q_0009248 [Alligator mississippiensis]
MFFFPRTTLAKAESQRHVHVFDWLLRQERGGNSAWDWLGSEKGRDLGAQSSGWNHRVADTTDSWSNRELLFPRQSLADSRTF